jgi:hypothetical protein
VLASIRGVAALQIPLSALNRIAPGGLLLAGPAATFVDVVVLTGPTPPALWRRDIAPGRRRA